MADMTAGDTAKCSIVLNNGTQVADLLGGGSMFTFFQGYLIF